MILGYLTGEGKVIVTVGTVNVRTSGSIVTVELRGVIGVDAVPGLSRTLVDALVHRAADELVIDLARASYLDPMGVGALVAAQQTAADLGVTFRVHNQNPLLHPDLV